MCFGRSQGNEANVFTQNNSVLHLSPHPLSLQTNVETISLLQRSKALPSSTAGTKQLEPAAWLCLQALPLVGNRHFLFFAQDVH